MTTLQKSLDKAISQLLEYCKKNNWAGWDPFDGLSSRVFSILPFTNHRIPRLIFLQSFKRLPVNLRPVFLVPKEKNPKGLALAGSALIILSKINFLSDDETISYILDRLIELRSPDQLNYCWGYNFDWQHRKGFLPKYLPNIIATTFAGNMIVDAYEKYEDEKYLRIAVSAAHFILNGLNIMGDDDEICFSYTPYDYQKVHNANMLGAAYLARIFSITKEKEFLDYALPAIRYSANKQNNDGSWYYAEDAARKWIDNFHTGFNLIALNNFNDFSECEEFTSQLQKGYKYYIDNLFTETGLPKYFHDRLYPIDIHSVSQSIITLVELRHLDPRSMDLANFIFKWATTNMKNRAGYFYYRKNRFYTNKIAYMRWSQAWMLLALSRFKESLTINT